MDNQPEETPDSELDIKFIFDIPASHHAWIMTWCKAHNVPPDRVFEFALKNYFKERGVGPEEVKNVALSPQQQLVLDTILEFARRGETLRMRLFEDE